MKIYELRLINVKSYVDETLTFQPGINFISGMNGAGKSTIIESIGYALFNYNPYLLKQFVREGANQGEIQVLIEGNDERLYRVIRKFNTTASSKWEAWDEETTTMLDELHGSADMILWLKGIMGIGPNAELADLFRQVIAVQQGLFTAPFAEAPAQRRKTFDAILSVEDFRQAFERTYPLGSRFEQETKKLQGELEGYAVVLPELAEVEASLLEGQVREEATAKEFQSLQGELASSLESLKASQSQKDKLDLLQRELAVLEVRGQNLGEQVVEVEASLRVAQRAQHVVEGSQPGYERYLRLQKQRSSLELELETKRRLSERAQGLEISLATSKTKLEADRVRWQREETELKDARARQNELLAGAIAKTRTWTRVGDELGTFATLGTKWEGELQGVRHWLQRQRRTLELAHSSKERLNELAESLGKSELLADELARLLAELALNEQADSLEGLRQAQIEKQAELDALLRNEDYLNKGLCPIILEACPSELVKGGLDEFFQEKLTLFKQELATLGPQIEKALAGRQEQERLKEQIRQVRLRLEQREQDLARRNDVLQSTGQALQNVPWDGLVRSQGEFTALLALYRAEFGRLEGKIAGWGLQGVFQLASTPPLLKAPPEVVAFENASELSKWLEAWYYWEDQFHEFEQAWESYGQSWLRELEKLQGQLNMELNLAKAAVTQSQEGLEQLQTKAVRLQAELTSFETMQSKVDQTEQDLAKLQEHLLGKGELEEQLKNIREELATCEESYSLYQANLNEAKKVEALAKRLADLSQEKQTLVATQTKKAQDQAELLALYSPEAHVALESLVQGQREAALNLERDLQEIDRERAQLKVRQTRLQEVKALWETKGKELEISKLASWLTGLLRQVLRSAADPIAQQYRNSLSLAATEIYRNVANENVRLEWASEYELQLVDHEDGRERVRVFRQLSGGEQMTAALAVRLSLMQLLSPINLGFFDEPTTNLDQERRESLALAIQQATTGFEQLFLISHDDSFDSVTENVIALRKGVGQGTTQS